MTFFQKYFTAYLFAACYPMHFFYNFTLFPWLSHSNTTSTLLQATPMSLTPPFTKGDERDVKVCCNGREVVLQ